MSNRVISFSDGFSSASAPTGISGQEDYTIANNITSGAILTLDKTIEKVAFVDYELRRSSSGGVYLQAGSLIMAYDGAWSLSEGNYTGDDMLVSAITSTEHVKLSINSVTGALTYDSGNLAGTSYSGTFKINITRIL